MSKEKLSYKGYEGSVEVGPDGRFTGKVLGIRCGLIYRRYHPFGASRSFSKRHRRIS